MGQNDHYWKNKDELAKKAKAHVEKMQKENASQIEQSIDKAVVYDASNTRQSTKNGNPEMVLVATDSITAAYKEYDGKTCILNFASYKEPGGGFLKGSGAQEECLCHESTLYNVLSSEKLKEYYEYNNAHKNRGLYEDRAIYTPGIGVCSESFYDELLCDVLTCAAPNRSILENGYKNFTEEENEAVLKNRIEFIKNIAVQNDVDTFILGAWGCGVFAQDPRRVAEYMVQSFKTADIFKVVFAVPNAGKSKDNYKAFAEVLKA